MVRKIFNFFSKSLSDLIRCAAILYFLMSIYLTWGPDFLLCYGGLSLTRPTPTTGSGAAGLYLHLSESVNSENSLIYTYN